ncbi:MAG: mercury methylation ferredoxin HgcB [Coriobacteriia bacterium]|nr:mercury methylation ferredoxin HgcB [Coriobacteriia bacterium]
MQGIRYIEDVVTLKLDAEKCTGCQACTIVCPHGVFAMADKRAAIVDLGACMECGACALNCASGAITLKPGVGCASAIIHGWLTGTEPTCGCSGAPAGDAAGAGAASCCGGDEATPTSGCCGGGAENSARGSSCC